MAELDKYSEITNLNFNIDNPHMAVCHYTQGYSANERPDALMFKSGLSTTGATVINSQIIKSLSAVYPEVNITKMTYENLRNALEQSIQLILRDTFPLLEDVYAWVRDFNEDLAVFNFKGMTYAVTYSVGTDDVVTLGDTLRPVTSKNIYVDTETGEQLVKAAQWLETLSIEMPSAEDKVDMAVVRATYENKLEQLDMRVKLSLKATFPDEPKIEVDIEDFDDSNVVFEYKGIKYAVDYREDILGLITLGTDLRIGFSKESFVDAESGQELLKARVWDQIKNPDNGVNTGDVPIATPQVLNKDKEGNMSELLTMTQDELDEKLTKAAADNETAIAKAAELKVAEILKAREFDELTKNTVELLKGVEAVGEEAANLTKSILATDAADLIVKALTDMQDSLTAARAEVETVKAKFGEQTAEEGQPAASQQGIDKAKLQAYVAQRKAATKA